MQTCAKLSIWLPFLCGRLESSLARWGIDTDTARVAVKLGNQDGGSIFAELAAKGIGAAAAMRTTRHEVAAPTR